MADLNAALKAEGQHTLILGNRLAPRNAPDQKGGVTVIEYANAITSNDDGSLGYELEGDLPRSQVSTSMCVRLRLTNIRLFDARKAGTGKSALLGGKIDDTIRGNEDLNTRPMVEAETAHIGDDGSWQTGLTMVFFGNVPKRAGLMYARLANGDPQEMMVLGDVDYTAYGLKRLQAVPAK